VITEAASLSRPPAFLGEDFPWKDIMEMYIKFTHYKFGKIITKGGIKFTFP